MSVVFIVINPASIHCLLNGILSVSIYYVANIIIILAWMIGQQMTNHVMYSIYIGQF